MKSKNYSKKNKCTQRKTEKAFFIFLFLNIFLGFHSVNAQVSSSQFIQANDTLTVYSHIPGLVPSPKYSIRVRSAATNNLWVNCFANYTYNKHDEVNDLPLAGTSSSNPNNRLNYQSFTRNWSQTYGNIEMSKNQVVEVEISSDIIAISKAAIHPAQKASAASVSNGIVTFTVNNPAQIVIDINGQMDDFNKGMDDQSATLDYVAHTISLFANPVIKKPSLNNSRVLNIYPGVKPVYNVQNFDTICFKPGIHNDYRNFKVHPGKTYYIPGDAIVYGTFNNVGVQAVSGLQIGENIKIYGYGTISGANITNPAYIVGAIDEEYKSIAINDGMNVELQGVCVADPAYHSVNIDAWGGRSDRTKEETFARWVKVISWRGNGDGIGSAHLVEDCFLRTADDGSYVKGNRRRCTFWKDFNAAVFNFSNVPDPNNSFPIVIEDCDVIYNRSSSSNRKAGVFVQRAGGLPAEQRTVNVTIRDFRITDPKPNTPVFNLYSKDSTKVSSNPDVYSYNYGSSYSGITFQNITVSNHSRYPDNTVIKQNLKGHGDTDSTGNAAFSTAPWYGGLLFENVTIEGQNLTIDDFNINQYVKDILFETPRDLTLTTISDINKGSISRDPDQASYLELSSVTLTAVPKLGYTFTSWSGDITGTTNPFTIILRDNMTVTANYTANLSEPIIIDTPGSGSWIVPDGVIGATIQVWGAGGSGGSAFSGESSSNTVARGGGGAGGSYASVLVDLTPGQVINYTVGEGGVGASSGFVHQSAGSSGGASYVILNNNTIVSGVGGLGGENVSITNTIFNGSGGLASTEGNIGDTIYYGGSGGTSESGPSAGTGGGGGSAGANGNGGNSTAQIAGVAGLDGGADGGAGHNGTLDGNIGLNPGGGGSGAGVRNSSSSNNNNLHKTGGKGGDGKLIIVLNQSTKVDQTINFNAFPYKAYDEADFALDANASSGLTVSYTSSNEEVATIVNGMIHIVGIGGTAIITASQSGDENFNAAADVMQTLSIDWVGITAPVNGTSFAEGDAVVVEAEGIAAAGIEMIRFRIDGEPTYNNVTTAPYTYTFTGLSAGSHVLEVQLKDSIGNRTKSLEVTINVAKQEQSITFNPLPVKTMGDADFALDALASSGLLVSYTSSNEAVATIVNGNIQIIGSGTSVITASQIGNESFNAAASVSETLTVNKNDQTITFSPLATKTMGDADFALDAAASSGLLVSYTSSDEAVATIVNGNIQIIGSGTSVITASQAGNDSYNAAESVPQTLTVNGLKVDQTINFNAFPYKAYDETDFTLDANASSGLTVSYTSSNEEVATIVDGMIHIVGVGGTSIITASQAGDENFNAAADVMQTLSIDWVGITAPVNGTSFAEGDAVVVEAEGIAAAGIEMIRFRIDGEPTYNNVTTAPYTYTFTGLTIGSHVLEVQLKDAIGNRTKSLEVTINVAKKEQSITFNPLPVKMMGDADFALDAAASSGLLVSYTSSNESVATIVNGNIQVMGIGTSVITASQLGNDSYNAATSVSQTLTVNGVVTSNYAPNTSTIITGSANSGNVSDLEFNDAQALLLNSKTSGTRILDWYSSTVINESPSSVTKLTVSYDGQYSRNVAQTLYLYNWVASSWTEIDSRSVSTADVTITNEQTTPSNFISSTGEIRLRVYSTDRKRNFSCSADWVQITVESNGNLAAKQLQNKESISVDKVSVFKVFPNPVLDFAEFKYGMQEEGTVQLNIYNLNGQLIKTLINNENHLPGNYGKRVDTSGLQNGLYFAQLIAGKTTSTIKIIVRN